MNKSKKIFIITAAVICLIVIVPLLFTTHKSGQETHAEEESKVNVPQTEYPTRPADSWKEVPIATLPEIKLEEGVSIQQAEKNSDEVIDRDPYTSEDHPEYIDGAEDLLSHEGKVCRNDKVISIDIMDDRKGDFYTISFGHITGECNRFLYLNPTVVRNDYQKSFFFHFRVPALGGGRIVSPQDTRATEYEDGVSYVFDRAIEQRNRGCFDNFQSPGVVWYPDMPLTDPVSVDCIVAYGSGIYLATLRLTIAKDPEDGTYSIVNVENQNLIQEPDPEHPEYTPSELQYLVDLTKSVHTDFEKTGIKVDANEEIRMEHCLIEYLDQTSGLHFNQFIPARGKDPYCYTYLNMGMPIMAVTYNSYGVAPYTYYYQVIKEPAEGEHGDYQYIGLDYPLYQTEQNLKSYGWDGDA